MFAEVAINAAVSGTFHYHIPPELDGKIEVGHLVRVAFGTAMQAGIVVALHADTPIAQTKPIIERLDALPVVTESQIELAYWLSRTYLTPLGLCLWLTLPPGLSERDIRVKLVREDTSGSDFFQFRVIQLLQRRGSLTGKQLSAALRGESKANWEKTVNRLVEQGIVETEDIILPTRTVPKSIHTAVLAIQPDQIPNVARHLGKASRRADLLEVIAAIVSSSPESELPTVDDVLEISGVSKGTLDRLADDGLVAIHSVGGRGKPAYVSLEIPPEAVEENLIELRNGYKDLHILKLLAREGQPVDVSWVYAQTDATLADLKRLAEDGLIVLGEKPAWRDGLAARDFVPSIAPRLTPEQEAVWEVIEGTIRGLGWGELPHPPTPSPQVERGRNTPRAADSPLHRWRGAGGEVDVLYPANSSPELWAKLKPLARQMRHEATPAENRLWETLRDRQQSGFKFRRQHSIDRFIVDFYCHEAHLIIEVDGEIHEYTPEEDTIRQQFLEHLGFTVLRFKNDEVFNDLDNVLQRIRQVLQATPPPPQASSEEASTLPEDATSSPSTGRRLNKLSLEGSNFFVFLLHGVTGSGKTEIYLRAIELTLAQGRQAIFLVPEIALTAQTVRRVAARFPKRVAVVHSGLTVSERYHTWRRAREGLIPIVVGTRSALFTPLPDVGLIVLDEEHDHSYKQSPPMTQPHYDARRVAEEMVHRNGGVLILGSATPDVETYYRAQQGEAHERIHYLRLPNRIMGHRTRITELSDREGVIARYSPASSDAMMIDLPPVQVVDMRDELKAGNLSIFSRALQSELAKVLERDEQAILFLNRRGQSTYVFCRDCGYIVACRRCAMPMTYHRQGEAMRCHHCGYEQPIPSQCPACGSRRIKYFGAGTQQVETELRKLFPKACVVRWDADSASKPAMHEIILQQFIDHHANVMIGTQMIAKGLDLPLVTLVGVISADVGLALPDFRAGEHTFQLLTQVAGRAGRGLLGGRVILQTYQPNHYAVAAASRHDYAGFYGREITYRREMGYPPFRRMARLVFRYTSETQARAEAERAAEMIRERIARMRMTGTELIGPAPCFFRKIDNYYRWHLIVRGPNPAVALYTLDIGRGWQVDIDPVDVL